MSVLRVISMIGVMILFYCKIILAHDLYLDTNNFYPRVGEEAIIKVIFGHNYPYYDILLTRDNLAGFYYITPNGEKKEIEIFWEERIEKDKGALIGKFPISEKGSYIVVAYIKRKGDKTHVPSEKYAKAIIIAEGGSDVIRKSLNHRIEIIPLKNPSKIRTGEKLPIKILFENKPLETYVYATYAGYYSDTEPFPIVTKSDTNGIAHIKILKPGKWMITVNHKREFSSTLTFEIKE